MVIKGKEVASLIPEFAHLRMTVFREPPYSYEGNFAEELEYLAMYAKSSDSVFVIAKDGDRMIGAATGLPLDHSLHKMRDFFIQKGIGIGSWFYLGEIILLKEYRQRKLGHKMYQVFEKTVGEIGSYDRIACMELNHAPAELFLIRQGFIKVPQLILNHSWKEIGSEGETNHPMIFLMKAL